MRLYMDCGEAERTTFHRSPDRLTFSHNSGIFVSNAGSTGLDKFVVSVKIHYNNQWSAVAVVQLDCFFFCNLQSWLFLISNCAQECT